MLWLVYILPLYFTIDGGNQLEGFDPPLHNYVPNFIKTLEFWYPFMHKSMLQANEILLT